MNYTVARVVHSKRWKEGTIKVVVQNIKKHPKYKKQYKTMKYYQVHYPAKVELAENTLVKIAPCAPVSKMKRFCIIEVTNA
jgi:ribosomal protein S17